MATILELFAVQGQPEITERQNGAAANPEKGSANHPPLVDVSWSRFTTVRMSQKLTLPD